MKSGQIKVCHCHVDTGRVYFLLFVGQSIEIELRLKIRFRIRGGEIGFRIFTVKGYGK